MAATTKKLQGSSASFLFGFKAEGSQRGWIFEQQGAAFLMERGTARYVGEIHGDEMSGTGGSKDTTWTFTAKIAPSIKKAQYNAALKT
jgi:hypothetical protein